MEDVATHRGRDDQREFDERPDLLKPKVARNGSKEWEQDERVADKDEPPRGSRAAYQPEQDEEFDHDTDHGPARRRRSPDQEIGRIAHQVGGDKDPNNLRLTLHALRVAASRRELSAPGMALDRGRFRFPPGGGSRAQ